MKYGFYNNDEDETFLDLCTVWNLRDVSIDRILRISPAEFVFLDHGEKGMFYADRFPTDSFGQIATYNQPPEHWWFYADRFMGTYSDEFNEVVRRLGDPWDEDFDVDELTECRLEPDCVSSMGEWLDPDVSQDFWYFLTYKPGFDLEQLHGLVRDRCRNF